MSAESEGALSAKAGDLRRALDEQNGEKLSGSAYGLNYFEQLRTEWSLLPHPRADLGPAGEERLQELLATPADELTWSDLYALERMVTRALPFQRLKRLATAVRSEYRDVVGAEGFAAYTVSNPPPADDSDEHALRADIEQLQCELQWIYLLQPLEEKSRYNLTKWLFQVMILLTALIICWMVNSHFLLHTAGTQPIAFVLFAGALGAAFSAQRRIQTAPSRPAAMLTLLQSRTASLSVQIAPAVGALCAVLLAFLFASGLLSGALFPHVALIAGDAAAALPLFLPLNSASDLPFALLIVWSFIAGFAERLIPDALDRLAAEAERPAADSP